MKRVNIVVEGHAEETYVHEVLATHFAQFNLGVSARRVEFGRTKEKIYRGGLLDYSKLKKDVANWLKQDRDALVTTMVDLYALPSDFPGRAEGKKIANPFTRVNFLEDAFSQDIGSRRFIPNILLHEFETLLFVDIGRLRLYYPGFSREIANLETENASLNPEEINEGTTSAPSKRILKCVPIYNKVLAGALMAMDIGLSAIRARCQHFNGWLTRLERLT